MLFDSLSKTDMRVNTNLIGYADDVAEPIEARDVEVTQPMLGIVMRRGNCWI